MRRAQHRDPVDLAAIKEFPRDEQGLDGLAHADAVGDEKPHGFLPEGHEQGHELVRARVDTEAGEAAEGARTGASAEPKRIPQQPTTTGVAELA